MQFLRVHVDFYLVHLRPFFFSPVLIDSSLVPLTSSYPPFSDIELKTRFEFAVLTSVLPPSLSIRSALKTLSKIWGALALVSVLCLEKKTWRHALRSHVIWARQIPLRHYHLCELIIVPMGRVNHKLDWSVYWDSVCISRADIRFKLIETNV